MGELLEIGSIVKTKDVKLMIAGYEMIAKNNQYQVVYTAVPFPQGFRKSDSVVVVHPEEVDLLQKGYSSQENDIMRDYFGGLRELAAQCSAEEFSQHFAKAAEQLQEGYLQEEYLQGVNLEDE